MKVETISLLDLFGKIDEWADKNSAPVVKVRTKSSVIEGQVLIGENAPHWAKNARPTEIWIKAECEIPLTSIQSLDIDDTRYIIEENNKG